MSSYMDLTAEELADRLDRIAESPQPNTGACSQLDEATIAFGSRFAGVAEPHQAFADARHAHMGKRGFSYTAESGAALAASARDLAAALRPPGWMGAPAASRWTRTANAAQLSGTLTVPPDNL
jgi:hypothetical protein